MLYMYDSIDDNGAGCYSEAQRTYADPCDWIALGSRVLTLHFYGDPDNDTGEQMYVGLEDNDGGYAETRYGDHGEDMGDITVQEWQEWSLDLHEFTGVDLTRIKRLCIGFGDRNNPQQGGFGFVYFDDLWLYAPRCLPGNGPAADLNGNCIVDLADVGQMVGEWVGTVGISADLYPDDIVNLRDYALLVNNWLEKELWPPQ